MDVAFDAPHTSSDGGVLLLHELDRRLGLCEGLGGLGRSLSWQPSLSRFENAADACCIRQMTHWLENQWLAALPDESESSLTATSTSSSITVALPLTNKP